MLDAVALVATGGHRLIRDYAFDPRSGRWRHRDAPPEPGAAPEDLLFGPAPAPVRAGDLADRLAVAASIVASRPDELPGGPSGLRPELEALREFHLPAQCLRPDLPG